MLSQKTLCTKSVAVWPATTVDLTLIPSIVSREEWWFNLDGVLWRKLVTLALG